MFGSITIPFGCVMMFNVVKLKEDVEVSDLELVLGEMCSVVKNTYGDDEGGFIGGQVFKFNGFISDEGSFESKRVTRKHMSIVTYWKSFEQHENSHADKVFSEKFSALLEYCSESYEIGYEMLWQGVPE